MPVAPDGDRSGKPGNLQLPIKLRQRHAHRVLQPPRAREQRQPDKKNQDDENAQQYAQNRPPAPLFDFNTPPESHLGHIVSSGGSPQ